MSDSYEYVALQEIVHDGVRAYHVGDFVPAENVAAHGYTDEQVAKRERKAAESAAESGQGTPPPGQGADETTTNATPAQGRGARKPTTT